MSTVIELIQALGDPDPVVRSKAARELGKGGAEAAPAVPHLSALLIDPDPMVRGMVAAALGKIGPAAAEAAPGLTVMLDDAVIPVRFWAADALGRIGAASPDTLGSLERLAANEHPLAKAASAAARRALRVLRSD